MNQEFLNLTRACLTQDKSMQAKNGHVADGCNACEPTVMWKALHVFFLATVEYPDGTITAGERNVLEKWWPLIHQ